MKAINKYLREVKKYLPGSKKEKQWILEQIRTQILSFPEDLDYSGIVEKCGLPKQVAVTQVASIPPEDLIEFVRAGNRVLKSVAMALVVVVALVCLSLVIALLDYHVAAHYHIVEGEAIVEERIEDEESSAREESSAEEPCVKEQ